MMEFGELNRNKLNLTW